MCAARDRKPTQWAAACSPGRVRAALGHRAAEIASPRSGRQRVAQGESAQPRVMVRPAIASACSGRQRVAQGESAPWVIVRPAIASPRRGRQMLRQGNSSTILSPTAWASDCGPHTYLHAAAHYAGLRSGRTLTQGCADLPWATCCRPLRGFS